MPSMVLLVLMLYSCNYTKKFSSSNRMHGNFKSTSKGSRLDVGDVNEADPDRPRLQYSLRKFQLLRKAGDCRATNITAYMQILASR